MKSIDIIHAEHRALGAVLQALSFILDEIDCDRLPADFTLLGAMIEYITEVPDKLHHPKEDDYLFVRMRDRLPQAAPLLDQLEHDHAEGAKRTKDLRAALAQYQAEGPAGFAAFRDRARLYVAASWAHLHLEERELLPLAREALTPKDWADIDAAFAANKDPWAGPAGRFRSLFSRIVAMVPAPYGLGAAPP